MKKYYTIVMVISLIIFCSCEDWLDIKPANKITAEELYSDGYGFRTNLNGLYLKMANTDLYGAVLSHQHIDILSEQYEIDKKNIEGDVYYDLKNRKWTSSYVIDVFDNVWNKSYNIIANANNILKNIKEKSADFFEKGEMEKNMIEGEALAVRAFLHFDLLRLFAPAPIKDDNNNYIPYVETYPSLNSPGIKVKECLNSIIEDLEKAKNLTISYDTTYWGIVSNCDGTGRFLKKISTKVPLSLEHDPNIFFLRRGFRLNYYSINALLARVYQYADQHDKALKCAEKVIDFNFNLNSYKGKMYKFNTSGISHENDLIDPNSLNTEWETTTNLKLYDNLIFATYTPKMHENWDILSHFLKSLANGNRPYKPSYFVPRVEKQEIFNNSNGEDESTVDIRYKYLIYPANGGTHRISGKWFIYEDGAKNEENFNISPLLRLTEIYYIAAESYARAGNFPKAKELLEYVRSKRGCSEETSVTDMESFKKELVIDARREWISEGQLFYLYKRLNAPVDRVNGQNPTPFNRTESIVPIPDNQSI